MKRKQWLPGLLTIFCSLFLLGCGINPPPAAIGVGEPQTIVENDTIEVTNSTISNGRIVVNLILDFEELTLNDLTIGVKKGEAGYDLVSCNRDETLAVNDENIFDAPYKGCVSLVFTDASISSTHELTSYYLQFGYDNGNGVKKTERFMISSYGTKESEAE